MKKIKSKNDELSQSFFYSYLRFFILIVFSVVIVGCVSFFYAKKELTQLGETAIKNRIQMGLAMMDALEKQVQDRKLTRSEAQEIFKSEMLNPKQSDGKTRGLNSRLELNIQAYMYAINSKGIEMMHPYKEGEDISNVTDSDGNKLTERIINEAKNPQNGGIVDFNWKNPGETKEKPKINAVAYFEPWDWYINVGCYEEDFYKPAYEILIRIVIISIVIILISILAMMSLMKKKVKPLSQIIGSMKIAAEGNMSVKIDVKNKDEIGIIGEIFNQMIDEIRNVLIKIKQTSAILDEKVTSIRSFTEVTAENSNNIKDAMEQISSAISSSAKDMQNSLGSMNMLSKNINLVKENSIIMKEEAFQASKLNSNIVNILTELENKNLENIEASKETNINIKKLLNKSNDIVSIVETIEGISNEINLLSLNASIESARAGEAGRGFAVVADQIKELSDQTFESVKQINELIKELIDTVNVSANSVETSSKVIESQVTTINETKQTLGKVIEFIENMPQIIEKNVTQIEEVYKSKDIVSSSMDSILSVTEEIAASSEEITASTFEVKEKMENVKSFTGELEQVSSELKSRLNKFFL
ncbi:methyl-accepting chemotaxis protein [Clostridium sp. WILCCON 0269]|uniref:Methyl-accepting chemotaxis protein n=1 Tax=Candidatus Clostridium eludens TaxID=3381663 RepID=A0ABW8SM93_9CLOT